jgi:hypothetical protein
MKRFKRAIVSFLVTALLVIFWPFAFVLSAVLAWVEKRKKI